MGEKNPKILCFGGVIGAGADAVQLAEGAPMYYLKEKPKCEIVADPADEPFTLDVPVRTNGFTLTGTVTVTMDMKTMSIIARQLHEADCLLRAIPVGSHLPRKMKKAHRRGRHYFRDTKWKRKLARWQLRNSINALGRITHDEDGNCIFTGKQIE